MLPDNVRVALIPCDRLVGIQAIIIVQLGERLVRNEEAVGSNPISSTKIHMYSIFGKQVILVLAIKRACRTRSRLEIGKSLHHVIDDAQRTEWT